MAVPVSLYAAALINQTTGLPMASQAATILNPDLSPATLYTDITGATVAGSNAVTSTAQAILNFFATPNGTDNSGEYVIRVAGQVDTTVQMAITTKGGTIAGPVTVAGPMFIRAVNRPRQLDGFAGVDPSGVTECYAAINTALAAFSAAGGGICELHPQGRYKIAGTVNAQPNVHVKGCWGGIAGMAPVLDNGSMFVWAGATNTPMVKFNNVQFAHWDGFGCDGRSVSGVTGVLIDSTNLPRSDDIHLDHYFIQSCGSAHATPGVGIQVGTGAGTPNYQSDRTTIGAGYIYACGTGIVINSDNAMDVSRIGGPLTIDAFGMGIDIQACGNLTLDGVTWGGGFGFPTRTVTDLVTTSGSQLVTSPTAAWTDADVGAVLTATGVPGSDYIIKVASATDAYVSQPATASATVSCAIQQVGTCLRFSGRWNPVAIRNCQAESDDIHMRVMPGHGTSAHPISFIGSNSWGKTIIDSQCQLMSIGNDFSKNLWLNTDYINWTSFDSWYLGVAPDTAPTLKLGPGVSYAGICAPSVLYSGGSPNVGYIQASAGALAGAIRINYQGMGFFAHAPVVQPATPVTLADVIAGLRSLGLFA